MNEQLLIPQTRYVDLVLGGHSHTFFETIRTHKDLDNNIVYNDQNGKSGIFIGKMTIQMEKNKR